MKRFKLCFHLFTDTGTSMCDNLSTESDCIIEHYESSASTDAEVLETPNTPDDSSGDNLPTHRMNDEAPG